MPQIPHCPQHRRHCPKWELNSNKSRLKRKKNNKREYGEQRNGRGRWKVCERNDEQSRKWGKEKESPSMRSGRVDAKNTQERETEKPAWTARATVHSVPSLDPLHRLNNKFPQWRKEPSLQSLTLDPARRRPILSAQIGVLLCIRSVFVKLLGFRRGEQLHPVRSANYGNKNSRKKDEDRCTGKCQVFPRDIHPSFRENVNRQGSSNPKTWR